MRQTISRPASKLSFPTITITVLLLGIFEVSSAQVVRRTRRRSIHQPGGRHTVVGTRVTTLPAGHSTVVVRGTTYYHNKGVYYKAYYDGNELVYKVVADPRGPTPKHLAIGTRTRFLPEAYSEVYICGETYYVSEGVYYKLDYVDNEVSYVIVEEPGCQ